MNNGWKFNSECGSPAPLASAPKVVVLSQGTASAMPLIEMPRFGIPQNP